VRRRWYPILISLWKIPFSRRAALVMLDGRGWKRVRVRVRVLALVLAWKTQC